MSTKLLSSLAFLVVIFLFSIFVFLSEEVVIRITEEDNIIENVGAASLLIASIICLFLFVRDTGGNDLYLFRTERNLFMLLFAIIFFFGFAEEISWGQRIFGWETPAPVNAINTQGETNIHNMSLKLGSLRLNMELLFSFFWFSYCCLLPLLTRVSHKSKMWCQRINLPIMPLSLGSMFLLSYILSRVANFYMGRGFMHAVVETKETAFEFLLAVVAIWFLTEHIRKQQANAAQKGEKIIIDQDQE